MDMQDMNFLKILKDNKFLVVRGTKERVEMSRSAGGILKNLDK